MLFFLGVSILFALLLARELIFAMTGLERNLDSGDVMLVTLMGAFSAFQWHEQCRLIQRGL